jgi:NAD(P)H-flavin reductase
MAPLPFVSEMLSTPPALLGFRTAAHAEAAELLPQAHVVVDPVRVTDILPEGHDVLACGPEPMLEAVARVSAGAQLAWEAPMACGYGACYGCAVEIDGATRRLCVEGPVLAAEAVAA